MLNFGGADDFQPSEGNDRSVGLQESLDYPFKS